MAQKTPPHSQSGNSQSKKSSLIGFLSFAVLLLAGYSLFSVYFANDQGEKAMKLAIGESLLLDQARMVQVNFKIQVQSWKNLLLRGQNSEDREKYLVELSESSEAVQKTLQAVLNSTSLSGELKQEFASILIDHAAVLPNYRKAFEHYGGSETVFSVDKSVRRIDQTLIQRIDRAALRIMDTQFSLMERLKQEAQNRYRSVRLTITLMTLGILVLIGLFVWKNMFFRRS
jgi:predicted component of type VI protein secretion system